MHPYTPFRATTDINDTIVAVLMVIHPLKPLFVRKCCCDFSYEGKDVQRLKGNAICFWLVILPFYRTTGGFEGSDA